MPETLGHPDWEVWLADLHDGEPPARIIEKLLGWAIHQTHAQLGFVLLPDPTGWWTDFAYVQGQGSDQLQGLRLRPEETLLDPTLTQGIPWRYHQSQLPVSERISLQKSGEGVASGLAVPLPGITGSAVGLLNFPDGRDASLLNLLQTLAPVLSLLVLLERSQTEQTRSAQVLRWLADLSQLLGDEFSLQHSLQAIGTLLRRLAPLGGGIWLYDENRTTLVCAHHYGIRSLPDTIPPDQLPANWQREPSELLLHERRYRLYPLRGRERVWGFIGIALPIEDPALTDYVPTLMGQFAMLIAHAMLYELTARRAQHMTTLFQLSLKLGETKTLPEVLNLMGLTAREIVPHDIAVVYLPDPPSEESLMPILVMPECAELWNHFPKVPHSLPGWVYAFNAPLVASNLAQDPHNQKAPLPGKFASALAVPLQVAERPLGVLMLLTETQRDFTLLEVELLFTLANAGALRLHTLGTYA